MTDDAHDATLSIAGRGPKRESLGLEPGDHLGRYELADRIGAGAMGVVFRARDTVLGRDVAIKVLERARHDDALATRLLREAQAMAQLRHDHLVVVFDVGEDRGHVYLAMELVGGGTLRRWLERERPWRDKLGVVIAAGRGLAAAHAAGVIHRDFKPDNVLIGGDGRAKVADFGLAKEESQTGTGRGTGTGTGVTVTQTGTLLGTPAYMAPEQHARRTIDARADQFALAIVAWEAVWGERPFAGDDYATLAAAVQAGDVRNPDKVPRVPRLEAVLRRALAVDPAARFASVDELIAALERAIRSRRAPWIAAAAIAIAGGAGAIAWASWPGPGEPAASSPRVVPADAVSTVILSRRTEILGCLEDTDAPASQREIVLLLAIGPDGRVRTAAVDHDESSEGELSACIEGLARGWRFPPPTGSGSGDAYVRYPFPISR